MPERKPSSALKKIAPLEGEWTVTMAVRPDPADDWIEAAGTSTFKFILGGTVLEQSFDGQMMDQAFQGRGLFCFNRITGRWQHIWSDNISGLISIYEGSFVEGRLVLAGKEVAPDGEFWVQISFFDITLERFKWVLETSLNLQDWTPVMKMEYIRKDQQAL